MEKLSKIYIAGHTGLVGSAIVRALTVSGFTNLIFKEQHELDLRNQSSVYNFFKSEKPEYVFLAAARVGGIWANKTQKADFIYDNLMIAVNVINAAKDHGVKKLLNLGSSCIYPKLAPQPLKEESLLTGPLEETNDAYAIAKIAAIKLCRFFNEQYNTNFISVMPTNLYGPNDNFNLETAHVLPALIRKFHLAKLLAQADFEKIRVDLSSTCPTPPYKCIKTCPLVVSAGRSFDTRTTCALPASAQAFVATQARESPSLRRAGRMSGQCIEPCGHKNFTDNKISQYLNRFGIKPDQITLWGSGNVFREFLYVDDLASALIFLMQNYDYKDIGEIINIGVGQDLEINKLAVLIKNIVGFEGEIKFDLQKPDGTPRKLLDISRIVKLGWKPQVGLEQGIRQVYDWYIKRVK